MTQAAIIVSHGQPSEPEPPEARLAAFAARVAEELPGWQISSATLATPGALEAALAQTPDHRLIYPMFMSEGWFTRSQLPKRVGDHPATFLKPFGTDPGLPAMAAELLGGVLAARGWKAAETELFLSGHGSGRSRNAARDTYAFAEALEAILPFAAQRVGFVEEAPSLAETAEGLGAQAISLPFFAAKLGHVLDDLPEALDSTGFRGVRLDPIGCAPQVPALVAAALLNSQAEAKTAGAVPL